MMHTISRLAAVGLLAGLPGPSAAVVASGQLDTTFASGIPVSSTADLILFTVNTAGTIVIDSLSWEVDPNTFVDVDVNGDTEIAYTDIALNVYTAAALGVDVAANDDDLDLRGTADGSIDSFDAYIQQFLPAGDYVLSVHPAGMAAGDDLDGVVTTGLAGTLGPGLSDSSHGDYQITFSGDVIVIPEPISLAWGILALAGLGHRRRMLAERTKTDRRSSNRRSHFGRSGDCR